MGKTFAEMTEIFLPEKIRSLIADEQYTVDDNGMSDASVFICRNKILKVQEQNEEAENEYRMMCYLQGKLPVPEIYAYEEAGGKQYLLMSRCAGQEACAPDYMNNPVVLCRLLADGLRKLWSIDISDCPSDQRLTNKLAMAKYNIENGLVDLENTESGTFGEGGFQSPEELLQWLYDHMPEEELVLSHGDYCLPNLFGIRDKAVGYIDLGRTGIADKWCDIALCYRSLLHNFRGKYRGKHCQGTSDYNEMFLFRELGIEPDAEKLRYYILLDELF